MPGEVCRLHRRIAGHRKGAAQGIHQLVRGFKFIEKLVVMQITQRPIAIVRMGGDKDDRCAHIGGLAADGLRHADAGERQALHLDIQHKGNTVVLRIGQGFYRCLRTHERRHCKRQ